ncbi:hypothetical protein GE061_014787 [Apolygus lucorum]|uniref:palmitoyl-protein hydrolase n=1 Tax=Apolygus lucorum TaxID=248454 RepID=A0A6A4JB58_APOLU|nr:hypothetical protein GE061_014787 [Apolygus lucorum]
MGAFELEEIVVLEQTGEKATAALIFLHGATLTGHDVKDEFKRYFKAEGHPYIKCYFPTAPERYLTMRDMKQRYWFDCARTGSANEDVICSIEDAEYVSLILDKLADEIEQSGIPRERIIIGGASQGGMVSIYATYVQGINIGGVVAISAAFPFYKQVILLEGTTTPLLSIYGQKDSFIKPTVMGMMWQLFRNKKINMNVKTLRHLGHDMDPEYTKLMFEWIEQKFPKLV